MITKSNKLTKSNTVACRGSKNSELSKYGTIFEIIPHESKQGLFILKGDYSLETEESEIKLDEEDENLPLDVNLEDLIDDKDANITEIDSNFFVL